MDNKKFDRIVRNPRHISGVHNYCDRWCERCPFSLRCGVYAMELEAQKDRPAHEKKKEELWPRLEGAAALADGLLKENLEHAGVGLVKDPIFKSHDRPLDSHRIGAAAKRYMEFAHKFVQQHHKALAAMAPAPEVHDVSAAEAFEVIAFYCFFIGAKVSRALSQDAFDEAMASDPLMKDMPRDQDGSAKIALISMDRSILAWAVLQLHVPEALEAALCGMLTLHRMRTALEKALPKSRAFVRPGFDTHRFPARKKKPSGGS